jgi:DNA-binding transcriptional ArsR family regulator
MQPADLLTKTHALLSDRVRLAIMVSLAAAPEPLEFNHLIEALGLSKGNLSSHVQKLEAAGLLKVQKEFVDRKPRTTYRCTPTGRREVMAYLAQVEALLGGLKDAESRSR